MRSRADFRSSMNSLRGWTISSWVRARCGAACGTATGWLRLWLMYRIPAARMATGMRTRRASFCQVFIAISGYSDARGEERPRVWEVKSGASDFAERALRVKANPWTPVMVRERRSICFGKPDSEGVNEALPGSFASLRTVHGEQDRPAPA